MRRCSRGTSTRNRKKLQLEQCPSGKVSYTLEGAIFFAKVENKTPYKCADCGKYHLTTKVFTGNVELGKRKNEHYGKSQTG